MDGDMASATAEFAEEVAAVLATDVPPEIDVDGPGHSDHDHAGMMQHRATPKVVRKTL